jgi:hypothetical protein
MVKAHGSDCDCIVRGHFYRGKENFSTPFHFGASARVGVSFLSGGLAAVGLWRRREVFVRLLLLPLLQAGALSKKWITLDDCTPGPASERENGFIHHVRQGLTEKTRSGCARDVNNQGVGSESIPWTSEFPTKPGDDDTRAVASRASLLAGAYSYMPNDRCLGLV